MRLTDGEQVLVRTRQHPRVLFGAAVCLILTAGASGYVHGLLSRAALPAWLADWRQELGWAAWAAAAVVVLLGTVRPLLRWLTRRTVVTDARLVQTAGLGRNARRTLPLGALADVSVRRRAAGSGDLTVTRFDGPAWVLRTMPEAERLAGILTEAAGWQRRWTAPPPGGWPAGPIGGQPR